MISSKKLLFFVHTDILMIDFYFMGISKRFLTLYLFVLTRNVGTINKKYEKIASCIKD
jgi:hypothetical protein